MFDVSKPLSVLTWNIGAGAASTLDPLDALPVFPEVVTLQDVAIEHVAAIRQRLNGMGYAITYSGAPDAVEMPCGNVIAARTPLVPADTFAFEFPWPQLVAHAKVATPAGPVNVVTVHVPDGSSNGWQKIDTIDSLKHLVLELRGEPLVLTGDFNEPLWAPLHDGRVITWGPDIADEHWVAWDTQDLDGVPDSGERWDAAVRGFFESPEESGVRNAFWDERRQMDASHLSADAIPDRWFDHVFCSEQFHVESCEYLHAFREAGLGDHSALTASLSR